MNHSIGFVLRNDMQYNTILNIFRGWYKRAAQKSRNCSRSYFLSRGIMQTGSYIICVVFSISALTPYENTLAGYYSQDNLLVQWCGLCDRTNGREQIDFVCRVCMIARLWCSICSTHWTHFRTKYVEYRLQNDVLIFPIVALLTRYISMIIFGFFRAP